MDFYSRRQRSVRAELFFKSYFRPRMSLHSNLHRRSMMHSSRNSRIEKAERGLSLLKEAIIELLRASPGGLRNTDIAKNLNLESAHAGGHRNFLTYSVLGQLIEQ